MLNKACWYEVFENMLRNEVMVSILKCLFFLYNQIVIKKNCMTDSKAICAFDETEAMWIIQRMYAILVERMLIKVEKLCCSIILTIAIQFCILVKQLNK